MPVEIDVDHVARLARLALTPEELARYHDQLGLILEHAAKVGEVAADDVPPTASAVPQVNVFRDDEPEPSLPRELVLSNAPEAEEGRFRGPRVVEME